MKFEMKIISNDECEVFIEMLLECEMVAQTMYVRLCSDSRNLLAD